MSSAPVFGAVFLLVHQGGCLWITAEEHVNRTDRDGDGVAAPQDCDDEDALVFPGSEEVPCDSIDNDCNPNSVDGPAAVKSAPIEGPVETVTFDSIDQALIGAAQGETLVVCAGRYATQLVITVPGLIVTGSSIPEATVFDAQGLDGPVIEVLAPDVTIQNVTVQNGVGRNREGTGTWGGGIYALEAPGTLTLNQVIVTDNIANHGAGVAGPETAQLVVANSLVRGNRSTSTGGGLYLSGPGLVSNTIVTENQADEAGGGLVVGPAAEVSLTGTTELRLNVAVEGGGALIESTGVLTGGWIVENTASVRGGGVASRGGELVDAKVEENVAAEAGGGVTIYAGTVRRGEVLSNVAPSGGGMEVTGNVDVNGTRFEGNFATDDDGGAILVADGVLTVADDGAGADVTRTKFVANGALDGAGGGIAAVGGSLEMSGGAMENCVARNGGAIAIVDVGICLTCSYDLNGLELRANASYDEGGAIWTNRSVTLENLELTGNGTYGLGGGIYATGSAVVTIRGGTATGNLALAGGVAAFVLAGAPEPSTIVSATFSGNESLSGAALLIGSGDVEVAASLLSNNDAGGGGAVAVTLLGTYTSDGVTYSGNESADVEVLGSTCSVTDDDLVFACGGIGGGGACEPSTACQ